MDRVRGARTLDKSEQAASVSIRDLQDNRQVEERSPGSAGWLHCRREGGSMNVRMGPTGPQKTLPLSSTVCSSHGPWRLLFGVGVGGESWGQALVSTEQVADHPARASSLDGSLTAFWSMAHGFCFNCSFFFF